jgi:uncharacterized Ntn-hydrolase superfamily protein
VTYSIIARDPQTGQFGVAVQSHYFSVGTAVPWAEAEVGAVATQAFAEISYGPQGLDLLRAGKTAEEAHSARRQVAFVDAHGNAAAHSGEQCIDYAGHRTAEGVSVQANMMERATVPDAMLAAYQSTGGVLAARLLAALDAAEAEGGDIRGRQSAAMLIVAGKSTGKPWADRVLELRVEDSPEPLVELRRLVHLQRSYALAGEAEAAATAGDMASATSKMMQAMQLAPDNVEIAFWAAMSAALAGQIDVAKTLLKRASTADVRWNDLVPRLRKTGMYHLSDETVAALTGD